MALWGGRFTQGPDQRFKDYNDSLKLTIIILTMLERLSSMQTQKGSLLL